MKYFNIILLLFVLAGCSMFLPSWVQNKKNGFDTWQENGNGEILYTASSDKGESKSVRCENAKKSFEDEVQSRFKKCDFSHISIMSRGEYDDGEECFRVLAVKRTDVEAYCSGECTDKYSEGKYVGEKKDKSGVLQVCPVPTFVKLYIDGNLVEGVKKGEKTIVYNNRLVYLSPGKHEVELKSEYHKPYKEVVKISPNRKTSLNFKLEVSSVQVALVPDPMDARVFVNGQMVGLTHRFELGRKYEIRATHPEKADFVVTKEFKIDDKRFKMKMANKAYVRTATGWFVNLLAMPVRVVHDIGKGLVGIEEFEDSKKSFEQNGSGGAFYITNLAILMPARVAFVDMLGGIFGKAEYDFIGGM